jgi:hypothetical protein
MTSHQIQDEEGLVVGGIHGGIRSVSAPTGQPRKLSFRKADFTRLNQQNHEALLPSSGSTRLCRQSIASRPLAGRTCACGRLSGSVARDASLRGRGSAFGILEVAGPSGRARRGDSYSECLFPFGGFSVSKRTERFVEPGVRRRGISGCRSPTLGVGLIRAARRV